MAKKLELKKTEAPSDEQLESLLNGEKAAEEQTVGQPAEEQPAEQAVEEPAEEPKAEKPAEEPKAEKPAEQKAEEPAKPAKKGTGNIVYYLRKGDPFDPKTGKPRKEVRHVSTRAEFERIKGKFASLGYTLVKYEEE